ncbi:MAG: hypothetical protein ACLFUI_05620, partial [Halanaerobiales bacterium]
MFNKGAINIKILMLVLLIAIVIYIIGCEGGPFDSGVDELDDDPGESTPIERGDIIETDHVIINGITFYFDDTYNVGTYTNGDYWVLGPVTLKRITPDYYIDETYQPPRHKNGWEVNPRVRVGAEKQGFDSKLPGYSSEKMPELPITITEHNSSIVKVISLDCEDPCYPALDFAAVLTVVTEIPPVNQFRPTYTGSPDDKIIRTLDDVAFDLLPSIIDK